MLLLGLFVFYPQLKIPELFPRRSRVAGSGAMRPAVLGNFVTARARCRAASHLQRPLPRRCHQPASLAARENRGCGSDPRSEAARPGPLRATSTATNRALALERGRGWAAADQRVGARGRSPAPRPTCWLPALVPEARELPRLSDHRDPAPAGHEPTASLGPGLQTPPLGEFRLSCPKDPKLGGKVVVGGGGRRGNYNVPVPLTGFS